MGERWFPQQLPATWIFQPPREDVGVDGVVVICDETRSNGLEFRVQIKSRQRWHLSGDALCAMVKRDSVIYWLSGFTPTLLVLYETTTDRGWCAWVNQLVAEDPARLASSLEAKTVTLRVPATHRLEPGRLQTLSLQLRALNSRLARRVMVAGAALPILEATHQLMRSLHLIDLCANGRQDDSQEIALDALLLAEITAHKEVVTALLALNDELRDSASSIMGLGMTARRYMEDCEAFVADFSGFVRHTGPGFRMQVNRERMASFRPEAIRAVTQIVGKLAALSLEIARENGSSQRSEIGDSTR